MGLFGSSKTKSKTVQYLPGWLEDKSKAATDTYFDAANRDYPTYDGQRIADFTPQQQQAFDLTSAKVGQWMPAMELASGAVQDTLTRQWPEVYQDYMNPYLEKVTEGVLRRSNEAYDYQKKQMEGKAAAMGAMYQPNYLNQYQQNAFERQQLQLQEAMDKGYADAYDKAWQTYLRDAATTQQGANILSGLTGQQATLAQGDVTALLGTGGQQQAREQALLDLAYQEYMNEFNYPQQQMSQLINFLNAAPYTKITKGTTTKSTSPGIIDYLAAPAILGGAYMSLFNGAQPTSTAPGYTGVNTGGQGVQTGASGTGSGGLFSLADMLGTFAVA